MMVMELRAGEGEGGEERGRYILGGVGFLLGGVNGGVTMGFVGGPFCFFLCWVFWGGGGGGGVWWGGGTLWLAFGFFGGGGGERGFWELLVGIEERV